VIGLSNGCLCLYEAYAAPAVIRTMRRRTLLAGLAAGLAGCFSDGDPGAGDPNETSDTPDRPTGKTPDGGEEEETPAGPAVWTVSVDGAVDDPVHTSASLRYVDGDGLAHDRWLLVPTEAGTLHALDPATGEHRWRADLGKPVRDVVVAADAGLVLARAGKVTLGDDHLVRAFDGGGATQWTFPDSAGANPWGPLELLGADGERAGPAEPEPESEAGTFTFDEPPEPTCERDPAAIADLLIVAFERGDDATAVETLHQFYVPERRQQPPLETFTNGSGVGDHAWVLSAAELRVGGIAQNSEGSRATVAIHATDEDGDWHRYWMGLSKVNDSGRQGCWRIQGIATPGGGIV